MEHILMMCPSNSAQLTLEHNHVYNFVSAAGMVPDNTVHEAHMEPTWDLSAPDGPHVGPMKLAIRDSLHYSTARPLHPVG